MNLKVISFNIRCKSDPDGNSIKERAPRLNEVISKYNPDLIGFQEYTPSWKPYINNYFGKSYKIFNKYRARFTQRESAPILWKKDNFKCLKKGYFWLSDTPWKQSKGWDELYNCYRICEYVVLCEKTSGKSFAFMNTHFGFGDNCQVKSAKLVFDYSQKISQYPTFVTGDFNMKPHNLGYKEITKYFADANTDKIQGCTYHGYGKSKNVLQPIDYCFCSDDVIPLTFKIIKDMPQGNFPSDHFGLFAKLHI